MTKTTLTTGSFLTIVLFSLPIIGLAQDISNEQRNAYEARQHFNKQQSNHQNLLKRVSLQEQRVAEENARLDQLKADELAAKSALDQAKVNLDSKVNALNNVWELRDK